jgi:hypothetical protein
VLIVDDRPEIVNTLKGGALPAPLTWLSLSPLQKVNEWCKCRISVRTIRPHAVTVPLLLLPTKAQDAVPAHDNRTTVWVFFDYS